MSGPIILLVLFAAGFVLVKYRNQVKDFLTRIPATATATTGSGTSAIASSAQPREKGWFMSNFPSILLVVGSALAVYWGFQNTQVRPADAGSWSQNHWLPLLILWSFGHAFIALNAKVWGATAAGTLHRLLAGVMLLLFIVLPFIGWVNEPPKTRQAERPTLSVPANGYSDHVLPPVGYATTFHGHGYTIHCVYSDGTEGIVGDKTRPCRDGNMLYQYVRDTTGQPNVVTYEFVRPRR